MGIIGDLKDAADILKEANKIKEYQQILEVQEKLLEMQKRIAELEEENKKLIELNNINNSLIVENNKYFLTKDDKKEGPFCMTCWDVDNKLVRLYRQEGEYYVGWRCHQCKVCVDDKL